MQAIWTSLSILNLPNQHWADLPISSSSSCDHPCLQRRRNASENFPRIKSRIRKSASIQVISSRLPLSDLPKLLLFQSLQFCYFHKPIPHPLHRLALPFPVLRFLSPCNICSHRSSSASTFFLEIISSWRFFPTIYRLPNPCLVWPDRNWQIVEWNMNVTLSSPCRHTFIYRATTDESAKMNYFWFWRHFFLFF